MSWRIWLPLVFLCAFLGLTGYLLTRERDDTVRSAMIGQKLPYFTLPPAVSDRPGLASTDLGEGRAKLLNIWASWCVPCIAEAPHLATLRREGAEIVGVAIRDRPEDVARFLARHGNPYTRIGRDDVSEVQVGIGSSGVPETFVVDGRGRITYQHVGDVRAEHVPLLLAELRKAGE